MPFDRLPNLNLRIPQTHFAPLPARIPNQKGLLIAQALAQLVPEALKHLSPEGKRRREQAEMEYNIKRLQYQALLANPTGKSALQGVQFQNAQLDTQLKGERLNQLRNPKSKYDPVFASGYKEIFGTEPPLPPDDERSLTVPQPYTMPDIDYDQP